MAGCAAVGCSNSSDKGKSMKRFPRDPKRRKLWAARTKRANWTPTDKSCLCEDHFDETQWEKPREDGKKKLKWNAEPTLFSFNPPIKKRRILTYKNPEVNQATPESRVHIEHTYYNSKANTKLENVADTRLVRADLSSLEKRTENQDSNETKMLDVRSPLKKKRTNTEVNPPTPASLNSSEHTYSNSKEDAELQNVADTRPVGDDLASNRNDLHTLKKTYYWNLDTSETKIKMLEKFVRKQQAVIRRLQDKVKVLTKECKTASTDISKKFLNDNQIKSLAVNSTRGFLWSDDTVKAALKLWFSYGTEAYEAVLSTGYPFPGRRTLRRRLEGMSGIQDFEFELLKSKDQNDLQNDT